MAVGRRGTFHSEHMIAVARCISLAILALVMGLTFTYGQVYRTTPEEDGATLTGDVMNWAQMLENYILQLANDGIKRDFTQGLLDRATYTFEKKDGFKLTETVQSELNDFFRQKEQAARAIAAKVVEVHDKQLQRDNGPDKVRSKGLEKVADLVSTGRYADSDLPNTLPSMAFNPYYRQRTTEKMSTVKISDEVPRTDPDMIWTVNFSAELDDVFKKNAEEDPRLRWQYFGSTTGFVRIFPGREWDRNFAGFYNDYDPRVRPWYIAAISGPKDVVIVMDCSQSMHGEKFSIAQAVAKNVIETLTKEDFVNVVCARASHWNEVGKWFQYETQVLSCQPDKMVQATNAHRKDLIEKIMALKPGGTSELEAGFQKAITLLHGKERTGCQSILIFITDGRDNDGEEVRCGPGYYTRSGYVPGPICKYDWDKVWNLTEQLSKEFDPALRLFSYLVQDEGEEFPGKLACDHGGVLKKLENGENLISKMGDYFQFLAKNAKEDASRWTSPYLDAWGLGLTLTFTVPIISKVTGQTIGVAGVDATLELIEYFFARHQWGTVYFFLINNKGESIFHPLLKPGADLVEDPMFMGINKLEGTSKEFEHIESDMRAGKSGSKRVTKNRKVVGRQTDHTGLTPATYYYAGVGNGQFAFAFNLDDTDMEFRRSQDPPPERRPVIYSVYNALKEYNTTTARLHLQDVFDEMEVQFNTPKYPNLWITNRHSSIFLPQRVHCDPEKYMYSEDLAQKTVDAHNWINGHDVDIVCGPQSDQKYEKGIRADVLLTQPVEDLWKNRNYDWIDDVKWTYLGLRSGLFRTYPGHPSQRDYDPTKRGWYRTAIQKPNITTISTPYQDAAGVGKIITISQSVFEGMMSRLPGECANISREGRPLPGGCPCATNSECIIGYCYLSDAHGEGGMADRPRCATERVEAVTSLDILYNTFHEKAMNLMESSDNEHRRSCGRVYRCPDGEPECQTRCYLFNGAGQIIMDPDFLEASALDERKYRGVTLGRKEGEVMKDLIFKQQLIKRGESMEFQGVCGITPYAPKVTLQGIPSTPDELDNYYRERGPIPKFVNEYGCIQDVISFKVDESVFGTNGLITGNVSGPCMSGYYYVTSLPNTNLFLLVIENWKHYADTVFFNFNCLITTSVVDSGAYKIVNGTCAHDDPITETLRQQKRCPELRNLKLPCTYNAATKSGIWNVPFCFSIVSSILFFTSCLIFDHLVSL